LNYIANPKSGIDCGEWGGDECVVNGGG